MELRTNPAEAVSLPGYLCISEEELEAVTKRNSEDLKEYTRKYISDFENKVPRKGVEEAELLRKFIANCDNLEQVVLIAVTFMAAVDKALERVKTLLAILGKLEERRGGLKDILSQALKEVMEEEGAEETAVDNGRKGNSPTNPN